MWHRVALRWKLAKKGLWLLYVMSQARYSPAVHCVRKPDILVQSRIEPLKTPRINLAPDSTLAKQERSVTKVKGSLHEHVLH